ncbi:MAG TPA: hypothetical protein VGM89_00715, partial [Puia sp.]
DFDAETAVAGETLPEEPATVAGPDVTTEAPILDEEVPFVLDESAQVAPESEPIVDEEPPFVLDEPVAAPAPEPVATESATPTPEPVAVQSAAPAPEPSATESTPPTPASPPSPPIPTLGTQPADTGLVFEPFHTIDYFASQGIKLSLDDPKDKLGKQLKSFTEWLKGMRRLPQKDREVVPDRVAEQAVQSIAAHSIEGKDVLTETMADVLAMQGMRERAKAVYEKLSLLNPGKRAYFAAKIEQLNIP